MQVLEQHFDAAFDAPDGIKRLRELILTLSMQGKLVEQDPNDQPARELLKEIEAEKRQLVAEGKIKAPKPLPPIEADEMPYKVPMGWEWVRLGEVTQIIRGITFPGNEKGRDPGPDKIACLRTANVQKNIDWLDLIYVDRTYVSRQDQIVRDHDIVMSMANSRELVGKVALVENAPLEAAFGGFLGVIRAFLISPRYLMSLLTNQYTREVLIDASSQTTNIANISLGKLNPHLIPFPPLAEQRRIVARIDELMVRCDELEALRASREQKRLDTHTAALNALVSAKAPDAFAEAWQFVAEHFVELHSAPKNVAELRKAVLQLAVMGKLVPQDPSDPSASELLKEIEAEKNRLIVAGKIRAPKPLPPVTEEEEPYQVPEGWEWVRLGEIIDQMDAGWSPQCEDQPASIDQWGVLKTTSVQKLRFLFYENKALPLNMVPRPEAEVFEGDILITRAGPKNRVGICCVVKEVQSKLMLSDKIIRFKLIEEYLNGDYLVVYMNAGYGESQIENMKSGMADSQVNISQDKLKSLVIMLPPLPEQHRIVTKIDQFMALCDQLEAGLAAQIGKQTELLSAVMAAVTPISITPTRRAIPARAQAAWADQEASKATEPKRRGRPAKVQAEVSGMEGELAVPRRRGRPLKNPVAVSAAIPSATSEADAIRRLEALKLERSRGDRQVGLFSSES